MSCPQSATQIQAYVDGELTGVDRASFEEHMLECQECEGTARLQSRFKAAVRGHLSPLTPPSDLESNIREALRAEVRAPGVRRWQRVTRVAPVLAAAGILIFVFTGAGRHVSPVIEQAVRTHTRSMPLDVRTSDCEHVASWFHDKVDFRVKAPAVSKLASCEGGRLLNASHGFIPYFRFKTKNGRRVSLVVYDNEDGTDELEALPRQKLGDRDVFVGQNRGLSNVAYKGDNGLWYIWTSDEEPRKLQNVVQSVVYRR